MAVERTAKMDSEPGSNVDLTRNTNRAAAGSSCDQTMAVPVFHHSLVNARQPSSWSLRFFEKCGCNTRGIDLEQFAPASRRLFSRSCSGGFCVMTDNGDARRDKLREELAALKEKAFAQLERRGYDVRGKTPAQIRNALRQRPKKRSDTEWCD